MADDNRTRITEFIFTGLKFPPQLQVFLFWLFLLFYLVTMTGNLGMMVLICLDSRLHTPMYFFLSHLSFVDICFSTVVGPKMLADFSERKAISFLGCALQQWFFGFFVAIECLLLASPAYDRYVAICNSLLYAVAMCQRQFTQLVAGPYAVGFLNTMTHTTATFRLPFCGSNIVNHFFCDMSPLLSLVCADIRINKPLVFVVAGAVLVVSSLTIKISYFYIFVAIQRGLLSRWQAQSLLHLLVPPDGRLHPVRDPLLHLRAAGCCFFPVPQQGGVDVLHRGDPHAQSTHLQLVE
ncbi:Olfactory receptor 1009 [Sciurus carolinensis]|uniref:Olfactory receptor 1009 n=1 Tax=Sciurus carolinensis TaxID=30640 RepID=A0AA41T4K3_SCICA|nr:Olfactory receptor 1009 [Sciurus carolinensis]